MFKVECPGCKAPYQVDERRVPPSGLKMRCPKCGTSFQVEPPPADPRGTSPTSPVLGAALGGIEGDTPPARPPLPKKKPAMKGTMIGVAPPRIQAPVRAPEPPPDNVDLPMPAAPRDAADPFGELDVPALRAPGPAKRTVPRPATLDQADLPSPAPPPMPPRRGIPTRSMGTPSVTPRPAVRDPFTEVEPTQPAADPFEELDFPAVPRTVTSPRTRPGNIDLPAVPRAAVDLPAVTSGAPHRGAPSRSTDEFDLPAASHAFDLPSVADGVKARGFGDDLPSLGSGADLPSLGSGADLPSPSARADLPSFSRAEGGAGGFGELDLPIVGGNLPSPAAVGLPANAAGLPANAAGLPANAAGLPIPSSDDPFGNAAPPVSFSEPPQFGGAAPDPFGDSDAFGGPAPDAFASASAEHFGAAGPAGDPFGTPPEASDGGPFGDGGFGQSVPPDSREFAPPQQVEEIVRKAGGGVAYGEVNLQDDGGGVAIEGDLPQGEPGDAAEFAGLPGEENAPAEPVARTRVAAAPGGAVAEIQSKRRKQRLRVAVATIVATALAGGALTLVPSLGPFGAYFVVDQLRRGDYERILAGAADAVHRALASDTYPDADAAMKAVSSAATQARRYKPLVAYTSFVGFSRILRFGGGSEIYADAKVGLDEIADSNGIDKLDLAQAAKAGVDGEIAKARQLLQRLAASMPRDVDVAIVRGEVELKAHDAPAALAAWKVAAALEKSPRTSYGLARATLLGGDVPGAQKLAEATIAASPHHVGARLLLAENSWSTKRDETVSTKLLEEILSHPEYAGPEERIEAESLMGEIHLDRGRVSQAEQAFNDAIKIADMMKANARGARALAGLGETLFRAGRYSQAIARFKAAAQADPDDLVAQVGVAKSSLELERPEEARDMLVKLWKNYPKDMQVDYWYGRVLEALGDRKGAEAAYRESIANGMDAPDAVLPYIALAGVLSQIGKLDAANETLSDAQKRLPASPALYKALGHVAMTQGRYADGLTAFEHAIELDPDDIEARFLVGTALVREREFDKALEIFDAVAKVDRDFPGLALERGVLFQESGRTEEALHEYESALAKAPNDPDLMLKVGCGKADAGDGDEAEKILKKVLEQRPASAETHFCLGRALMAKREFQDSIKEFERAIQIDPNHAEYQLYVGWASNEGGDIGEASVALKRALELDQGLADAYWQRGVLRVRETRAKDAVEDLKKALELRPSRFEAHADLARAYDDLGKEDLALAEWQKALAANPNEATWRFNYGKMLSLRSQNGQAAEQLKKAIELAAAQNLSAPWLFEAHRLAAVSLGMTPAAIPHWQAFLKTGPANSPFRDEAKAALKRLGAPWDDSEQ